MTYRLMAWRCATCDVEVTRWQWDHEGAAFCPQCHLIMAPPENLEKAAAVIGDDVPGGFVLNHVALKDGQPQRFYSKRAAIEAARAAGWTRYGETPKEKRYREV